MAEGTWLEPLGQGLAVCVSRDHGFGADAFLLAGFAGGKPGDRAADLGTGCGILPVLLYKMYQCKEIYGLEIQKPAVEQFLATVSASGLEGRVFPVEGDLRRLPASLAPGSFDLVVCNPPYYPPASGKVSGDSARRTARSETEASLADICAAASYLLRWGGKFCLVHKPERLTDTACALREAGMEPKRLRFVQNRPDTAPSLFLIEGCRGGKPGVDIQPPLLLQTDTGAPTGELNVIYFRDQEV